MKNAPNSKSNLDRALQRFAGDFARANELRGQMANAIVAQIKTAGDIPRPYFEGSVEYVWRWPEFFVKNVYVCY